MFSNKFYRRTIPDPLICSDSSFSHLLTLRCVTISTYDVIFDESTTDSPFPPGNKCDETQTTRLDPDPNNGLIFVSFRFD